VTWSLRDLPVADGFALPEEHRALLRPGELMHDRDGRAHRLPRFFYRLDSAEVAVGLQLTPHFELWEFIEVDVHEAPLLRAYPRYVPCAITLLAAALEVLRDEINAPVRIAANGGYRSPSHAKSVSGSPHCWGTAANIFRIGPEFVDDEEKIDRYATVATKVISGCWTRPFGHEAGFADDHLHVDIGYVTLTPRDQSEQTDPHE
jgi:hypothetical protein